MPNTFTPHLGRLPSKSDPRAVMFARFLPTRRAALPKATNFWTRRKAFTFESWGNLDEGCCTIAKQANMFRRFERLEQRRTIAIAESEVHTRYREMTSDLYGGGDTGAYETDALDRSRRPDLALRDGKGRPLTIDAYTRIDPRDHYAMRHAIYSAGGHGIAVCLNLPTEFDDALPPDAWDLPPGVQPIGSRLPGSWGGHSMWAIDYDDARGILLEHTWEIPPQWITWRAAAVYLDEAHLVIDSVNAWKKRGGGAAAIASGVRAAVNEVSSVKIK